MYYSVNIPKSLMVYITPQPSSEPWRILHNPVLAKVYIVEQHKDCLVTRVVPRTKISDDTKHTFAWTIERFSERTENNSQFLWSSKFTIRGTDDDMNTHWKMKLYPKGDTPEASGYLSVYLSNQTDSEVKARYEFTILGE